MTKLVASQREMATVEMTAGDASANRFQRVAHAKINLSLHVTGRRDDGYHLLDSLVGFAALGDIVSISSATADVFEISGPFSQMLSKESPDDNLVVKARDWLKARHGDLGLHISSSRIHLQKRLPIASGIGGGSSDAAATLGALARLWRTPADVLEDHATIAAALGADVPMCLHQSPLRVTGIGEKIAPWLHVPLLPCVLVNPGQAVSTPAVFKALGRRDNEPLNGMPPTFGSVEELAHWLRTETRNDLQAPAQSLCPPIETCRDALHRSGALLARMSGSGATCFGLFGTIEGAQNAASAIAQHQPEWFVETTAILPSPPQRDEDYGKWVESMKLVRSLH
ncbi:MAG: 4-(cytidine 5'-diphospho)-2-C-methyl-D-erythritol kinase [Pseudomonadota bacterium]